MFVVALCLAVAAVAAWISIVPWLKEHDAAVKLTDSSNLKSSLEQIKGVDKVADLIRQSNAQWQGVQDASARTVASASEITEKMKVEADEFMKFIANAHDQERSGLRLEVEKLRRMEADWIKVAVQMLDHIFALSRAAERSGQQQLIKQLHQFQNACRDVARRMGLAPFVPIAGELFDERAHQLPNPQMTARNSDKIQDVLASGFTYQGQLLRRALVVLENSPGSTPQTDAPAEQSVIEPEFAGTADASEIAPESATPTVEESPMSMHSELSDDAAETFEEVPQSEHSFDQQEERAPGEAVGEEPRTGAAGATKKVGQEELPF